MPTIETTGGIRLGKAAAHGVARCFLFFLTEELWAYFHRPRQTQRRRLGGTGEMETCFRRMSKA